MIKYTADFEAYWATTDLAKQPAQVGSILIVESFKEVAFRAWLAAKNQCHS